MISQAERQLSEEGLGVKGAGGAKNLPFSPFIVPLETNAVGVGRDNQTIEILQRSELILDRIISER
jgi:hypothetical protein